MIFLDGTSSSVLLILAVLPAAVVMFYVWKMDKREKEPVKLLLQLFGLGALSTVLAIVLEMLFTGALSALTASWIPELPYDVSEDEGPNYMSFGNRLIYQLISNFVCIALVEESGKFMMLHLKAWKSPEFDYSYDAVVYAVATSLGFATVENILYVFTPGGGLTVALLRAVLSVPGHAIFAVFMGWFYGRAKYAKFTDNKKSLRKNMWLALLVPTALHGFYDFCLNMGETAFIIIFFVFEIAVMIVAILLIRHLSNYDQQVAPPRIPPFIGFPGMPGFPGYPGMQMPVYPGMPFPGGGMPQPYYPNQMAPTFSSSQFSAQPRYPAPQNGMMMKQSFGNAAAPVNMPQMQQNPGFRPQAPAYGMPQQPMFGMPPQNPAFRPQVPPYGAPRYPMPQQQGFFMPPPASPQFGRNPQQSAGSYPNGYARAGTNANATMEDLLAPQPPQAPPAPQMPANPQNGLPQQPAQTSQLFSGRQEQNPLQQPAFPQQPARTESVSDPFAVKEPAGSGSGASLFSGAAPSHSLFQANAGSSDSAPHSEPVYPASPVIPPEPALSGFDQPGSDF